MEQTDHKSTNPQLETSVDLNLTNAPNNNTNEYTYSEEDNQAEIIKSNPKWERSLDNYQSQEILLSNVQNTDENLVFGGSCEPLGSKSKQGIQ